MNQEKKLDQETASEDSLHRLTPPASEDPEVIGDASAAVPRSQITTMAQLPIIFDDRWHLIHGTEKVTGGALQGMADGNNCLFFPCPQCKSPLRTHLAGVSADFTEWKPSERGRPPEPIAVFKIDCVNCGLRDHFKIACDQHGHYQHQLCWKGGPLPKAQSRRVSLATARCQPLIPVIREEDADRKLDTSCYPLRAGTSTDYINIECPRFYSRFPAGGLQMPSACKRLLVAVADPKSLLEMGAVVSIAAFRFQLFCGPVCKCAGYCDIPVTDQKLQLCAR